MDGWYEASADDVFVKLQGPFFVGKNIFSLRFFYSRFTLSFKL